MKIVTIYELGDSKIKDMSIKYLLVDLDGVLIPNSSKETHFKAFNEALESLKLRPITLQEHLNYYDGLSTRQKIKLYYKQNNLELTPTREENLHYVKQEITNSLIYSCDFYLETVFNTLFALREAGYKLGLCTNSIRKTTETILENAKIKDVFDIILTNEDVKNPKPHPEIYLKAMVEFGAKPNETLIIEDSPTGIRAGLDSGAKVFKIKDLADFNYDNIVAFIEGKQKNTDPINIIIPMAGLGSRFEQANYSFPKPIIDVMGKPMISWVVDSLGLNGQYTFIVQKSHAGKYALPVMLNLIARGSNVIQIEGITEGAACTVLKAKEFIDNDKELIIANSDQYVDFDANDFLYYLRCRNADFGILTFKSNHPRWSYAKTDENGLVTEVAEKVPISEDSSIGIYYWKRGSDFVWSAEEMIRKDIRVGQSFNGKGELYVMPTINELISIGKKGYIYNVPNENFYGLGVPEDLEYFIANYKK